MSIEVKKAKNIKATEAKDIEVTEARDIEVGKAIEVPEVAEFLKSLEASAKPQIDTSRKERKKNFLSEIYFVNKSTNLTFEKIKTCSEKKSCHVKFSHDFLSFMSKIFLFEF